MTGLEATGKGQLTCAMDVGKVAIQLMGWANA